jgi:transcriptional regulator with XRE-family HTH domain
MTRSGADLLKQYRKDKRGWSQEELAEEADISRTYLSALERGDRTNPRSNVIEKIAGALDLDSDERELLRNGFNPPPLIEPSFGDREIQLEARRVWVFSSRPAEGALGRSENPYRETLKKNLKNRVRYVYWTTNPERVEVAIGRAKNELDQGGNGIESLVECVEPPPEANFFNFAIYWQRGSGEDEPVGRLSLRDKGSDADYNWSLPIDDESLRRIQERCMDVLNILRLRAENEENEEPEYQGYKWRQIKI